MQRARFFRWMEQLEREYNKARYGSQPREVNDEDIHEWDTASEAGFHIKPTTRDEIRNLIRSRNPVRWRQTQGDLRWVERQMKRLGLNPEDARFII